MIKDLMNRDLTIAANPLSRTSNPSVQGAGQAFDQFMSDLEQRNRDTIPRTRESLRRNEGNARSADRRPERVQETSRESMSQENSRQSLENLNHVGIERLDDSSDVGTYVTETADIQDNTDYAYEEIQIVIIEYIAEAVQVPPDVLLELLEAVEIQAEELADPTAANKFLQNLLKVESPVELLTMPEYQDSLKQLTETVADIVEKAAPTEVVKPALDRLAGLVATVDEQNNLYVSMEESYIAEETEEDNHVQVPNNRRGDTNTTDTSPEAPMGKEETVTVAEAPEVLLQDAQPVDVVTAANPAAAISAQAAMIQNTAQVSASITADPVQVMQQIIAHVKTAAPESFSELRMTLRPEHLGDVTLRIAVQNGVVMAMFVAENQRIKEIIESNFNQLREALAEQGIEISELFVSVNGEDNPEEQMNQYIKAQQEAMRRLQRAAGAAEEEEPEEPAPIDPSIVLNNTVDFSA